MRSNFFSADGAIHITRAYDKPRASHSLETNHSPGMIEKINRERDVCLNCTKEKCSGSDKCFNKHRKESEE